MTDQMQQDPHDQVDEGQHSLHSLGAYRHILDAAPANAPAGPYGSIDSSGSEELCPQEWTGHQDVISQNDEIRSEDLVATPKRSLPPTESDNLQSIKRQHVDPQDPQSQEPSAVLKIFKCFLDPFCEMRFTRAEHLARHERKHTKEKPFRCHCKKAFSRLDNWRQHKSSVHKYALEENRQTELLLVQVHKGMQRENHKRKLAIVAAQKKQQSESAPASKPRATASKSKPSPKTSRVQGAYSPVRSTQGRTFCSDLSHATPIASIRYPEYPPTSCFSPYLHEINHSGSGYASSSGVPYPFQDHLSSIGFSPAYNESPRTPHLSSNFPMHSSPDFEVDRVPSYADFPISSTVNTIPEVAREPYSHIMMEPFGVPSDSDLLSSRQLIPMQPFQPSRKANTSSMFPNPCQLDTESYSQLSNLTSRNVGIPSVCTTEQNSWPPFSFSHPRISLGPSYLTGSHFAPNENMDQSAFREYCHSEASLMQPEPWNEHSTSYLASTPYDGFSKGLEESAHPRMEISHINPSASTHDEHADNLEVFFK